ncbi:hypothetical protein LIP_1471 [Limnochorda pilosa]|uniref:Uncharacterized protein n=1 Tax=Limnochorda pilosa TaxID=1555112 RepID=A0A0K2SJQ0_LIMPI|nr:hypothetical protein LIP_1471 [Limnochorda pilosa]
MHPGLDARRQNGVEPLPVVVASLGQRPLEEGDGLGLHRHPNRFTDPRGFLATVSVSGSAFLRTTGERQAIGGWAERAGASGSQPRPTASQPGPTACPGCPGLVT